LSRYYGFSIAEIGDMSMYQFHSYLNEIPKVEKIFSGKKSDGKKPLSGKELVSRAKQKGLRTPKHF